MLTFCIITLELSSAYLYSGVYICIFTNYIVCLEHFYTMAINVFLLVERVPTWLFTTNQRIVVGQYHLSVAYCNVSVEQFFFKCSPVSLLNCRFKKGNHKENILFKKMKKTRCSLMIRFLFIRQLSFFDLLIRHFMWVDTGKVHSHLHVEETNCCYFYLFVIIIIKWTRLQNFTALRVTVLTSVVINSMRTYEYVECAYLYIVIKYLFGLVFFLWKADVRDIKKKIEREMFR